MSLAGHNDSSHSLGMATYVSPICSTRREMCFAVSGEIVDVSTNILPWPVPLQPASSLSYMSSTDWSSPKEVNMISASFAAASAESARIILG